MTSSYDEAFDASGGARPAYADLLDDLRTRDLDAVTEEVNALLAARGVSFGAGSPFRVDPVPRLLSEAEWQALSAGLAQRVRALDAFVADVYGECRAVREGVVPERVVTGSPYWEPDLVGDRPAGGAWISLAGLDLVRGQDGRFRVLEDNVRTPSGITYALAAAEALAEVLGVDRPPRSAGEELAGALRRTLEASAPGLDGALVLLSDGPGSAAWYEHQRLAELADLVLAYPSRLRLEGDRLALDDGRRVRAVYRRTDEDRLRAADGSPTALAALVREPMKAGTLGMVNRFGTGVADDKLVYSYVDDLVRFYLGEEPAVPSVTTYDLEAPDRRAEALERMAELVVKPRDGQGGEGVVVGPVATAAELDAAREAVVRSPGDWIVQEFVQISTHPTVVDGRLAPRHVDLRPFVLHDGAEAIVPRLALTRVALGEGSMVVNSSREGGGKATWVG